MGPFSTPHPKSARKDNSSGQKNPAGPASPDEPPRFRWNAQADSFSLSAHRTGQAAPQISRQLCLHGYNATTSEVTDSLHRQGVPEGATKNAVVVPALIWDAYADAFAASQHRSGQTIPSITAQLCRFGYMITTADVVQSLNRQGYNVV